jgi:hypothetical protein
MNTKFQLFIIVIIGLFCLSSSYSVTVMLTKEKVSKSKSRDYVAKSIEEKANPGKIVSPVNAEALTHGSTTHEKGSSGMESEDDGSFHFFHFNRIKRFRRCVQNLCLFAKIFLIYTHASWLIMEFMHLIHY